jgi:hypothetical protein
MYNVPKYKRGDICGCTYNYRVQLIDGTYMCLNNTIVRVTSVKTKSNIVGIYHTYNVYNMTLDKYDQLGESWLRCDKKRFREYKIDEILNIK